MVTSIDDCYEIIERLRNERNDLRHRLDVAQREIDSLRQILASTEAERNVARRQLAEGQAELDQVRLFHQRPVGFY